MKLEQIASWLYFACCICLHSLVPSLPLLADLVVQSLLVVLLCHLVFTEVEVLWNMAALGSSSGPNANIGVGEA